MLKRLDETGAEFHKVDATQTSVKKLSTKIKMAIHVINLISSKINTIRDEELWPQMKELIQGYVILVHLYDEYVYIYFSFTTCFYYLLTIRCGCVILSIAFVSKCQFIFS